MIQINLLPSDFRGRERLSIKVWGTLLAAVVVFCCSLGYFGHVYLNEFKTIEGERVGREDRLNNLKPQAKYDDDLVAEAKEYKKRAQTIQDIAGSRVLWTRLVDQFIDIVNNEGETERHNVWFRDLNIRPGKGKPTWSLNAMSQTKSFSRLANFLDDIKNHPEFFADFRADRLTQPGGKVVKSEGKHPPRAVKFRLNMQMKPAKEWKRNKQAGEKR
jgi:hypothetical protein